jgi:polyphosphate glucokinase
VRPVAGAATRRGVRTLSIDIGGSGLKASVLDHVGGMLAERLRVPTPVGRPPLATVQAIVQLARRLPPFDRISVRFPGAVGNGTVLTAPNLRHRGWLGFDLAGALARRFRRPVRMANDVALQGSAAIRGKGVELVITLGTGVGSALYLDGIVVPQFGIGHLHLGKHTYDERLNNRALEKVGTKKWNRRLRKAVAAMRNVVKYDHLYIGGGNAKQAALPPDPRTTIISNEAGIRGGIVLWRGVVTPARRAS